MSLGTATAFHDFTPQQPTDLAFKNGDTIQLIEDLGSGWFNGTNLRTGQSGMLPSTFIKRNGDAPANGAPDQYQALPHQVGPAGTASRVSERPTFQSRSSKRLSQRPMCEKCNTRKSEVKLGKAGQQIQVCSECAAAMGVKLPPKTFRGIPPPLANVSEASSSATMMAGWLLVGAKSYKPFWAILDPDKREIRFYKDAASLGKESFKSVGVDSTCRVEDDTGNKKGPAFKVVPARGKAAVFAAKTPAEKQQWMDAVSAATRAPAVVGALANRAATLPPSYGSAAASSPPPASSPISMPPPLSSSTMTPSSAAAAMPPPLSFSPPSAAASSPPPPASAMPGPPLSPRSAAAMPGPPLSPRSAAAMPGPPLSPRGSGTRAMSPRPSPVVSAAMPPPLATSSTTPAVAAGGGGGKGASLPVKQVRAAADFAGEAAGDLSFKAGEIITVIRHDEPEGWWDGVIDASRRGIFPSTYVDPLYDGPAGSAPGGNPYERDLLPMPASALSKKELAKQEKAMAKQERERVKQAVVDEKRREKEEREREIREEAARLEREIEDNKRLQEYQREQFVKGTEERAAAGYNVPVMAGAGLSSSPSAAASPLASKPLPPPGGVTSRTPSGAAAAPAEPPVPFPPLCKALYTFDGGGDSDALKFEEGDIIIVLSMVETWWKGTVYGRVGHFPENYVERLPASATRKQVKLTDLPPPPHDPSTAKPFTEQAYRRGAVTQRTTVSSQAMNASMPTAAARTSNRAAPTVTAAAPPAAASSPLNSSGGGGRGGGDTQLLRRGSGRGRGARGGRGRGGCGRGARGGGGPGRGRGGRGRGGAAPGGGGGGNPNKCSNCNSWLVSGKCGKCS